MGNLLHWIKWVTGDVPCTLIAVARIWPCGQPQSVGCLRTLDFFVDEGRQTVTFPHSGELENDTLFHADFHGVRGWDCYVEGVRLIALRALGDSAAADDVAQETVLRAMEASLSREVRDPAAFVHGIARHLISDFRKHHSRLLHLDHAAAPRNPEPDALHLLISREDHAAIGKAVKQLPPDDQKLLAMAFVDGLKSPAIASHLGVTSDNIRKRKSRLLDCLRAALVRD